jgi:hypothetical protein
MKNIFVIPTDKYSPLVHSTSKYGGLFLSIYYSPMKEMGDSYQNIYITSDEEIKEGDWCYDDFLKSVFQANSIMGVKTQNTSKKIILTTDQDLIKDGVQDIDDEFLEWFIKNPSCEEGEVDKNWNYPLDKRWEYKIIIPKEEQKQHLIDIMRGDEELGLYEEPKQDTLEEFIEREGYPEGHTQDIWETGVRDGVEFTKEQILQFLYSEITERRDYSASKMCEVVIGFIEQLNNK